MNNKTIEILAPAGSVDRMKAAFAGGADACYIGGKSFGARAYADNPEERELVEAIHYAHLHDKRLYMTLNTLVKEEEMRGLFNYVLPYYEAGIDGILVQDFGVMKFLHENFPNLVLHASTQMTVCDTGAAELLKKYGIKRLVLSRELSLTEVAGFKNMDMEIECFVHGALCVCYSGQCLMSALNGGRSGNRGSCAGPCRMSYNLYAGENDGGIRPAEQLKAKPYLLSPKDICTLDLIPEMVEAGIHSFKIEGRMKRAEYAALTAYLYRKWTDIYLEKGCEYFNNPNVIRERNRDVEKLSDIYNRGSFTNGYLISHNGADMMASSRPNHNGVAVGKVKAVKKGKLDKAVIFVTKELNAYDVVEIRAEDRPDEPVYEFTLKEGRKSKTEFEANFSKGLPIREGMSVYRTKNESLLTDIRENIVSKPLKRRISARFFGEPDKEMTVTLIADGNKVTVSGAVCLKASNRPVEADRIADALVKLGDTEFVLDRKDIEIELKGEVFFPMSALNELRRTACEALFKEITGKYKKKAQTEKRQEAVAVEAKFSPKYSFVVSNLSQLNAVMSEAANGTEFEVVLNMELMGRANVKKALDNLSENKVKVYLRLPEIFRKNTRETYERYFSSEEGTAVLGSIKGFLARNLEEIDFIKRLEKDFKSGFEIVSDTNLYTFNARAVEVLVDFGINRYTGSLEQSLEEMKKVRKNIAVDSKLTLAVYGREELMVMTQCQWKNKGSCVKELKKGQKPLPDILYIENKKAKMNGKAGKFPVIKECESCTNYVYQDLPLNLLDKKEEISELSPDFIRIDFTFETETEVREVIKLADFSKRDI